MMLTLAEVNMTKQNMTKQKEKKDQQNQMIQIQVNIRTSYMERNRTIIN